MPRSDLQNVNPKDTHSINISVYKPNGISSFWSWFSRKNKTNIPSSVLDNVNNYKIKLNVEDLNSLKLNGIDIQNFHNFKQDNKKKSKHQSKVLIIPKRPLDINEIEFVKDCVVPNTIKEENVVDSSKLFRKQIMSNSTISVSSNHNFVNTNIKYVKIVESQKSVNTSLTSSKASYKVGFKNNSNVPIQTNHLNRSVLLKSVPTSILKSNTQKKVFIPLYLGKKKIDKSNMNQKSQTSDNLPSFKQETKEDNNVIPMLLTKIKSMEEQISDIENKTNKINEVVSQNNVFKTSTGSNSSVSSKKNIQSVTKGFASHKVYTKKVKSIHPKRFKNKNKFTVPTVLNASQNKDFLFKMPNYDHNRVTNTDDGTHYNRHILESPDIFFKQHNYRVPNNISKKELFQTNPDVGCEVIMKLFNTLSEAKDSITADKTTVTEPLQNPKNDGDMLKLLTKPTFGWKQKSVTSASETQMERNKKNNDKNSNYKIKKHSSIPIPNKTINGKKRNELFNNIMTSHLQQNIIYELLGKELENLQLAKAGVIKEEPQIRAFQKNERGSEFCKVHANKENKPTKAVQLEVTYENKSGENSLQNPLPLCNQISIEKKGEPKLNNALKQCEMFNESIPQISQPKVFTNESHKPKGNLCNEHEKCNERNGQINQCNQTFSDADCCESGVNMLNSLDKISTEKNICSCCSDNKMILLNKNIEHSLEKDTIEKEKAATEKFTAPLSTNEETSQRELETLTTASKVKVTSETDSTSIKRIQHSVPCKNIENEPKVNITILVEDNLKDSVKLYSNVAKTVDTAKEVEGCEIHNRKYCIVSDNVLSQENDIDRVERQKLKIYAQEYYTTTLESHEQVIENDKEVNKEVTDCLSTSEVECDVQSRKNIYFSHPTHTLKLANMVDRDNFLFDCPGTYINHERRKAYDEKLKGIALTTPSTKSNCKTISSEENCKDLPVTLSINRFISKSSLKIQENICNEIKHKINMKNQIICKSLQNISQDNQIKEQFATESTKSGENFETNIKINSTKITTSCISSMQLAKQSKSENRQDDVGKKQPFFTIEDNLNSSMTPPNPEIKRRSCRSNMTLSKDPIPEEPRDKVLNLKTSISDNQSEKGDNINIKSSGGFCRNVDDNDKVLKSDTIYNSTDTLESTEKCLSNSVYTQTNWSLVGLTFDQFKHIYTTKNTVCIQTDVVMQHLNVLENQIKNIDSSCNKDTQQSEMFVCDLDSNFKNKDQPEASLGKYIHISNKYKEDRIPAILITDIPDTDVQDEEKNSVKVMLNDVSKNHVQVSLHNIIQTEAQVFQDSEKETICNRAIDDNGDINTKERHLTTKSKNKNPHHCCHPCFPFINEDTSDLPRTIFKNLTPLKRLQSVISLVPQIYNHNIYIMTNIVDFTEMSSKPNTYCKIIPAVRKGEGKLVKIESNSVLKPKSIYKTYNPKPSVNGLVNANEMNDKTTKNTI